jgi:glycosyltransferase involved in cell wall biosynthesis
MRFIFVSERTFEPWDWTNPEKQGIGGSETSHIEMAQRLARRGHEVISYAPLDGPETFLMDPACVEWRPIEQFLEGGRAGITYPVVYVIYRAPHLVDLLPAGAIAWLICQDTDYTRRDNLLSLERALRFTRIVTLCGAQAAAMRRRLPELDNRPAHEPPGGEIIVSSNGIKSETIERIEKHLRTPAEAFLKPIDRNPLRMIYASSPDRGLENLLPIFERVREIVPGAELHVCYGFNNIDRVVERYGAAARPVVEQRARLLSEMERLGVHHYGRLGQTELLAHWLRSAVWCHPSNFTETSCITCMDAQACGAVPVTTPIWAIAENVEHGVFIEGDVRTDAVRARYVHAVAELLLNPHLAEQHRAPMMPWARRRFDWENFVDQWHGWANRDASRAAAANYPITEQELADYPGVGV